MGGVCSAHGDMRNGYKILVGKPKGKLPLVRLKTSVGDNIKMCLRRNLVLGVDLIHVARDEDQWRALVNTTVSFPVP
jgi:hypothetical protein